LILFFEVILSFEDFCFCRGSFVCFNFVFVNLYFGICAFHSAARPKFSKNYHGEAVYSFTLPRAGKTATEVSTVFNLSSESEFIGVPQLKLTPHPGPLLVERGEGVRQKRRWHLKTKQPVRGLYVLLSPLNGERNEVRGFKFSKQRIAFQQTLTPHPGPLLTW
jgi:hypothetical protein